MTPAEEQAKAIVDRVMSDGLNERTLTFDIAEAIRRAERYEAAMPDMEQIATGKIYAIKAIRNVTGWGLKEAKDIVEAIAASCQPHDAYQQAKDNALRLAGELTEAKAQIAILQDTIVRIKRPR
jgi:ribosomal protein L7/L12